MAKLQTPNTAGFNANNGYTVKYVKIDDIVIDPEIAGIFQISDKIKNEIMNNMKLHGYNKEEPVTLWGKIIIDGRTRYTAAKEAGIKEIPAVERNFESREEAIMHTFERQAFRRNLTGTEILAAADLLPKEKSKNGNGRAMEDWAKRLGISVATMYQANSVLKNAPEEDLQAIKNGEASIKKIYNKNNPSKKETDVEFIANDAQSLPENVKFLRSAVVLLIEGKHKQASPVDCIDCQNKAVKILINHFLKKNERNGFFKLLPDSAREYLERFYQ